METKNCCLRCKCQRNDLQERTCHNFDCSCHVAPATPQDTQTADQAQRVYNSPLKDQVAQDIQWETQFNELFSWVRPITLRVSIKFFIQNLLSSERTRLATAVEGMKGAAEVCEEMKAEVARGYSIAGYEKGFAAAIEAVREKLETAKLPDEHLVSAEYRTGYRAGRIQAIELLNTLSASKQQ